MDTLQPLLGLMFVVFFAVQAKAVPQSETGKASKAVPVGDFSVVPLWDGEHNFPLSFFKGADEATMRELIGAPQPSGSFDAYLIRHGKECFLVDVGNGALRPDRIGQLPLSLKKAKTAPEDISKIFITHFHGDHIGGLIADGKPAFPKAQVYVAKAEYDYWTSEEIMRQVEESRRGTFLMVRGMMRVLEQAKLLVLFTPGDVLSPGITSVALFGHTPGHTGFMLDSGGQRLFFVGDLVHAGSLQFPRPDITAVFDSDQMTAKETRLRVFKQVVAEKIPIAAVHLPFPGIGLVRPEGGGYRFEEYQ